MKNFISFLIFLLFAWLALWWYYSCNWCSKNTNDTITSVKEKTDIDSEARIQKAYDDSIANAKKNMTMGLFAKDIHGNDVFRYPESLKINSSTGTVFIPESLQGFSNQIASHLGANQDQELIIYGYESAAEIDRKNNYGIARANFIKDILIKSGINADRIVTKPKQFDYTYDSNGEYHGGIDLSFGILDTSRLEEVEKGIANKTLYAGFAEKTFLPDATLSNYTLELKSYLTKYPNKSVTIIGHTDNVGSEEANLWYGQQRADNVKKYFVSQGISGSKVKASSKGELEPIVPNSTDENKAKNRRIEIIVN